jgi:hypothetical protein
MLPLRWRSLPVFPRSRRARSVLTVGLLLGGALFVNELVCNLIALYQQFGGAKVMRSVASSYDQVFVDAAGAAAWMLAVAAALSLLVGLAWAAVAVPARTVALRRWGRSRATRLAYWSVATLVFFNAWYSLELAVLPASRLSGSALVMLSGALDHPLPLRAGALPMPAACALAALLFVCEALARSARLRRQAAGATLGLAALVGGYSAATAPGAPRPFLADRNVVILGLDSLQMNRLAVGGSTAGLAPNISAFLAGSFRFDNAWTPLARTYPSWMSLITGREPPHHGVRFNLMPDDQLAPDNPYLPAHLQAQGWSTFHATDETRFCILRERFGYERLLHPRMGVQDFVLASVFDFSAAGLARQCQLGHDLFPAIADNRASCSYNPDIWARDLVAALDEVPRDQPAFLSMHLCGNHWPFSAPAPWAHSGGDPVESCIRMVDEQAGVVLRWLNDSGLLERSVVAMLSDHGDGWSGDPRDKNNAHGDDFKSLYANKIVLGFRAPGLGAGRSGELVRITDVYPTLLELAGVVPPAAPIDGLSLVPLMRGEGGDGNSVAPPRRFFAETDLDRKLYTVKQLIDQQALWYQVDRGSGLVFLTPHAVEEFSFHKSYTLIEGDRRLEITPYQDEFKLFEFDPATGLDRARPPLASEAERAALLEAMVEHFGLDREALSRGAQARGYLPRLVSKGE